MSIKDDLKARVLALTLPGETEEDDPVAVFNACFYGTDFSANMQDDTLFPLVHIQNILVSGADISPVGSVRNRWNIFMYFAGKHELDATDEQIDATIDAMRTKSLLFIGALNKSGMYDIVTKVEYKHLQFKFDYITAGVLAFFTLKEKNPSALC